MDPRDTDRKHPEAAGGGRSRPRKTPERASRLRAPVSRLQALRRARSEHARLTRASHRAFQHLLKKHTPGIPVTYAVLGLNGLAFLWLLLNNIDSLFVPDIGLLIDSGGNYLPKTTAGEWWRMLTATFLHAHLLHIVFNMAVFWMVGPIVERMLGNIGFAVLYLSAGLAGSVGTIVWNHVLLSIGASGAVLGCYGALVAIGLRDRESIPRESRVVLLKQALVLVGMNLGLGLLNPQIDNAAHVGGVSMGFVWGLVLYHPLTETAVAGRYWRAAGVAAVTMAALVVAVPALPRRAEPPRLEVTLPIFPERRARGVEENARAWALATDEQTNPVSARAAVVLARMAVDREPHKAAYWSTLAAAHCRAGDLKDAVLAANRGRAIRGTYEVSDLLVLALARWKQGQEAEARDWLLKSRQVQPGRTAEDPGVQRLRREADRVISLPDGD